MRNHHPLYSGLLYPAPEAAPLSEKAGWRLGLTHSNVYMFGYGREWAVEIDKEMTELDAAVYRPFHGGRFEAGAEVSLFYAYEGFLDGIVRWYHERTGAQFYAGQKEAPDYRFLDGVYHDGKKLRSGRAGAGAGDARFWLKTSLWKGERYAVSLQAIVEAPTGDAGRGMGSGMFEYALRALASVGGGGWSLHAGGGAVRPGGLRTGSREVRLDAFYTGYISAVYRASDRIELLAQTMFNTSPAPSADIYVFRDGWAEGTLGLRLRLENGRSLALGFSENLTRSGPDFSIQATLESH